MSNNEFRQHCEALARKLEEGLRAIESKAERQKPLVTFSRSNQNDTNIHTLYFPQDGAD
jgi:hypothetical protein